MRIALLVPYIPPYSVPRFEQLRRRVDELRIFICTPMEQQRDWEPDWGDLPVIKQRTLTWHQVARHPAGFTERNAVHFPIDTLSQLHRFRPDVVITSELGLRSLLTSLHCLRHRGTGLVLWATVSQRSEAGRGRLRKLLRRYLVGQLDAVLVNGASGARYMIELGVPPECVFQMPQAVDIEAFRGIPTRPADCAHRFLHVGQLIERKGIVEFLRAMARYAESSPSRRLEVCFAGTGPLRSAIQSMSCPANLHIHLRGHANYSELRDIYMRSGILAFPTLSDEWGLVVLEAMLAGLPVLGSIHAQAVEELIQDGVNGWTFDPVDTTGMDRAIKRALATPTEVLDAMRARAMAAVDHITPERMADRMVEACRFAMSLRRQAASSGVHDSLMRRP
jgi:glycosyltransferase involved in cell wall biosynthesis